MLGLEAIDLCVAASQLSRNHLARVICRAGARFRKPNDGFRPSQTFSLITGNDRVGVELPSDACAGSGDKTVVSGIPVKRQVFPQDPTLRSFLIGLAPRRRQGCLRTGSRKARDSPRTLCWKARFASLKPNRFRPSSIKDLAMTGWDMQCSVLAGLALLCGTGASAQTVIADGLTVPETIYAQTEARFAQAHQQTYGGDDEYSPPPAPLPSSFMFRPVDVNADGQPDWLVDFYRAVTALPHSAVPAVACRSCTFPGPMARMPLASQRKRSASRSANAADRCRWWHSLFTASIATVPAATTAALAWNGHRAPGRSFQWQAKRPRPRSAASTR